MEEMLIYNSLAKYILLSLSLVLMNEYSSLGMQLCIIKKVQSKIAFHDVSKYLKRCLLSDFVGIVILAFINLSLYNKLMNKNNIWSNW